MLSLNHSTGAKNKSRRLVTLTRRDPDFSLYLDGELSGGLRALPVESFSVNSARERVTFALVDRDSIVRPSALKVLAKVGRWQLISLSIGPLVVALAAVFTRIADVTLTQGLFFGPIFLALAALISVAAFHTAAFAFNDYQDHILGVDRIQHRRGSQVIQRGWMTAKQIRRLAIISTIIGVAVGLPIVWLRPMVLPLVGLLGLSAVVGYSFQGRGFKYQGVGDLSIFACMGPLVTYGIGHVFGLQHIWGVTAIGLPFGLAAVILLQLRQLETILVERISRSGTLVARLGFDRAKYWIGIELLLLPLMVAVGLIGLTAWWLALAAALPILIFVLHLRRHLLMAASPLSSNLLGIGRRAMAIQWLLTAICLGAVVLWPIL